ncbi:monocarboxylate transporter 5-like isoform X2 [Haemaphysalis longicornis]
MTDEQRLRHLEQDWKVVVWKRRNVNNGRRHFHATKSELVQCHCSHAIMRDVPPRPYQDSARSWIVAVAGAWTLFWVMILSSCSGIIFVTIVSEMGASREAASWPFNLLAAVINVSGVVAGLLLRTFPLRAVSMAGSLLTALGVLLCAVFYDVTGITVCFGVLCGFGQGLIFPSNDLAVNTYFIKYRASGSGISWAGGSLVALVFPSVVVYLNDVYGLRGTFVVVGGLTLNAAAGSLLIHNPEALARQSQSTAYRRRSDGHWPGTGNRQLSGVRFYEVAPNACEENQLETDDSETAASAPLMSTKSEVKAKYQDGNSAARASQHSYGAARWDTGIPSNRKGPPEHSVDAEGDVGNNNTTGLIRKAMFAFRNELGFLKRPITYVITFSSIVYASVTVLYAVTLVDYAMGQGVPEWQAAFLLSSTGASDIIGRLVSGQLSDRKFLQKRQVMAMGFLLMASSLISLIYANTMALLVLTTVLYGLAGGSLLILFAVIAVEYLGLKNLPLALSFQSLACALVAFPRPLLIGYYRDRRESYAGLYALLAATCLAAGLVWTAECFRQRRASERRRL